MRKLSKEKTIVDIAERLHVSIATVSRALSDFPYVKESTRLKVQAMAKELGYQRNYLASGLRNNKTHTIGLIVPRISMYFHSVLITTIQNKLYVNGYNLLICQTNDDVEIEKKLVQTLFNSKVDAVVAACTYYTTDYTPFDKFVDADIPLIFYDRIPTKPYPALFVEGEDYKGGFMAIEHLIKSGAKNIAFISGPQTCFLYEQRAKGVRDALSKYGLTLDPKFYIENNLTYDVSLEAMKSLFENSDGVRPDGIFACNDTTAIAAIEYCRSHHINIPGELKLVGYSNDPRSAITTPSITTIDQNPEAMGERIVKEILKAVNHTAYASSIVKNDSISEDTTDPIIIPIQLIKRASS